ncbi:MAG: hypothetical protein M1839_004792 [Geoglossum umbratile]|nr:MAG: hypothetical protein M1839_004792 [Geoglossum umbratile]
MGLYHPLVPASTESEVILDTLPILGDIWLIFSAMSEKKKPSLFSSAEGSGGPLCNLATRLLANHARYARTKGSVRGSG